MPEWTCGLCSCTCTADTCPDCGACGEPLAPKAKRLQPDRESTALRGLEAQSGKAFEASEALRRWLRDRGAA